MKILENILFLGDVTRPSSRMSQMSKSSYSRPASALSVITKRTASRAGTLCVIVKTIETESFSLDQYFDWVYLYTMQHNFHTLKRTPCQFV